jgi:hypothetical protein
MRVSEVFPSKYLAAEDLDNKNVRLTISNVEIEKLGEDTKPVIYFRGHKKGLACNKTNAKSIAAAYGDEMDEWIGSEIILFPVLTDYQGKSVPAIRVRAPQPKDNPKPIMTPSHPPKRQIGGISDMVSEDTFEDSDAPF